MHKSSLPKTIHRTRVLPQIEIIIIILKANVQMWSIEISLSVKALYVVLLVTNPCNLKEKVRSKVQFLGQGGACNSAPNRPNDLKFCIQWLLWVTIEFWSSQGHVTSIEAKPFLAYKSDWPL